jgi:hypothetical protein
MLARQAAIRALDGGRRLRPERGAGQERLSSAGRGMTIAGLIVGVVCLLLTVPFLMGSID